MDVTLTFGLILISVAITALFHYEALRFLLRFARRRNAPRSTILLVLVGIVSVHFAEITYYAFVHVIASDMLGLGSFGGDTSPGFMRMMHFSAETYSTLGYGDVVPKGDMRMLAGAEALNGLLLLAWSGSALFLLVQDLSLGASGRSGGSR